MSKLLLIVRLIIDSFYQYRFSNRLMNSLYIKIQLSYSVKINKSFKRRIILYVNSAYYFAKFFEILHNFRITKRERETISLAGAFLGIGDSLFDNEDEFSHERIRDLIAKPQTYVPLFYKDAILLFVYQSLLNSVNIENRQKLKRTLLMAYYANVESEKQKTADISFQLVQKLSLKKGGYCGVFYRLCLQQPLTINEYEAAFRLGELSQLIDDAIDIREDTTNNIQSVFTGQPDFKKNILMFNKYRASAYNEMKKVHASKINIVNAIFLFDLAAGFAVSHLKYESKKTSKNKIAKTIVSIDAPYLLFVLIRPFILLVMTNSLKALDNNLNPKKKIK